MTFRKNLFAGIATGAFAFALFGAASASADEVLVGLITKTDTNPFFAKMKEGAEAKAKELGVDARSPSPASTTATMTARSPRSRT